MVILVPLYLKRARCIFYFPLPLRWERAPMPAYPGIKASAPGPSAIVTLNMPSADNPGYSPPPWALGVLCTVSPGATLIYTVQVTGDAAPSADGNWNSHDTLVNQTASANGNVVYPITGLRLNVTSYSSGTVNLAVVQWP